MPALGPCFKYSSEELTIVRLSLLDPGSSHQNGFNRKAREERNGKSWICGATNAPSQIYLA
jgi:hypothetical protein